VLKGLEGPHASNATPAEDAPPRRPRAGLGLLGLASASLAGLLPMACQRQATPVPRPTPSSPVATATAGEAKPGDVVAEVGGVVISRADLERRAEGRLVRLRQEEYEILKDVLDEQIAETLLEREAKRRGISIEELKQDEIDRQVPRPSKADVAGLYQQNRQSFPGQDLEQARPQLETMLREGALASRRQAFASSLRANVKVTTYLEPPRSKLASLPPTTALGPADAKVTIVEFADYQCPYCHRAQHTIETILARYAGKVRLVHRDFPLEGHSGAFPAARAARCAEEQGRFWDYHRQLMLTEGDLSNADLKARADRLRLDAGAFASCLASNRHDAAIREAAEAGRRAGVTATPTYFINGRMLVGARPPEAFAEVIEAELAQPGR
jgi:protein-disulfide isomerase